MGPSNEVMRAEADPSAFETQISRVPDREDMNAIFLPSGEYFGVWSNQVEEIKTSALTGGAPSAGSVARQIFVSSTCLE